MRIGIEKLAWWVDRTPDLASLTLGELARLYEETPERIMDAIDVIKIRRGEPTQIPPVSWSEASDLSGPDAAMEGTRHKYGDSYSGMLCGAMVMREGFGDMCGLPHDHPIHNLAPEGESDS